MAILLAYWLFLFLLSLPYGVLLKAIFKLKPQNAILLPVLGLFSLTVINCILAFFFPLKAYVLLFTVITGLLLWYIYKNKVTEALRSVKISIASLSLFTKSIFTLLIIAALVKSSGVPQLPDNYSYYIQSIKWFNEYGFVKGLGNLHLFLGQASPWHVVQAGLNFSFFTDRINDLNGFIFVLGVLFCITEAEKQNHQWIGFIPAFSVVFLFFLDSPSPDLPLVILTPVIIYLYLEKDDIKTAFALFLFIAFIKVTIAPFGLLFLLDYIKHKRHLLFYIAGTCFIFFLWVAKNSMITGYPLYPLTVFPVHADWLVPEVIIKSTGEISNTYIYGTPAEASWVEKITGWLLLNSVDGLFNKLIIIFFITMLFFKEIRQNIKYHIVYISFLFHFTVLLFTSPQFRFFLPEIIFFTAYILNRIFVSNSSRKGVVTIGIAVMVLPFLNITPANKYLNTDVGFIANRFYIPSKNSGMENMNYTKEKIGNLEYYSPEDNFFMYSTGNGPLPCVNKLQVEYFKSKYGYIPQLRGYSISTGFYSKHDPEEITPAKP